MAVMINEAMIFSAGLGTRMLPLTRTTPKPLIKINKKSILVNNIEKLLKAGFRNIVINAFYFPNKIHEEVKSFYPKVKVIEENERLETGGGLLNAMKKNFFKKKAPIVLINGDVFWINKEHQTLDKMRNLWDSKKMDILLCLQKKKELCGYQGNGDFDLSNSNKGIGRVLLRKNPEFVFTGLQIINPVIMKSIRKKVFSTKELIFSSINEEKVFGYIDNNPWYHIGTINDLENCRKIFE
ncbi:MAG: sugar phosphate nucleotidyltransferase [Pseudomonadota bacterium]|nr:sugar phosphate nucleotidyltransferase [Pseudomonadota bacterium]